MPGKLYRLQFRLAGNVEGGPAKRNLHVIIDDVVLDFAFDVTGKTKQEMGWVSKEIIFTAASDATQLAFVNPHAVSTRFGVALDHIVVRPVAPQRHPATPTEQVERHSAAPPTEAARLKPELAALAGELAALSSDEIYRLRLAIRELRTHRKEAIGKVRRTPNSLIAAGAEVVYKDGKPYRVRLTDGFDVAGLKLIEGSPHITELEITTGNISDDHLAYFSRLSNLKSLTLPPRTGDEGLRHLRDLTQLEVLNLSGSHVTAAGMAHLQRLTNLRELSLRYCLALTDDGLQHLAGMNKLQSLDLRRCAALTDAALEHIRELKSLESINMAVVPGIGSHGLAHLTELTGLKQLGCSRTGITDLEPLQHLTELRALGLPEGVDDAQIVHLKGLTKLKYLCLEGAAGVTDDAMPYLAGLQDLESLRLEGTSITDHSMEQLKKLPNLGYLQLQGTKMSDDVAKQLGQLHPQCKIVLPSHRGG